MFQGDHKCAGTPKIPKGITKITVVKLITDAPDSSDPFHGIAMVSCFDQQIHRRKNATSSHDSTCVRVLIKRIWQLKDLTKTYFTCGFLVSS